MGQDGRGSVLGHAGEPNASRRTIVLVLGTCIACALLLVALVATALIQRFREGTAITHAPIAPPVVRPVGGDLRPGATPLRGNPGTAFGPDAYPVEAERRGEQGRTVARLIVGPSGRPVSCAVVTSSGSRTLDEATCRIARDRVRYQPARDAAGHPIASAATLPVRWVLPQSPQAPSRPPPRMPLWMPLLLAAFAGYQIFAVRAGLRTGRMPAPRGGRDADRATAPALFWTYTGLAVILALAFGTGAVALMIDALGLF